MMKKIYESKKPVSLPDFPTGLVWFNTEGKDIGAINKITLIDFWAYSCINSVNSVPFLKYLYEKYSKYGFEIIAVHSPEFNFEKNISNVRKAVDRLEISYPVVMDNYQRLWSIFNNVYLPSYYLYGVEKQLRFTHFGEDYYYMLEDQIIKLIKEKQGYFDENKASSDLLNEMGKTPLPDIYTGYDRITGLSCYEKILYNKPQKYTPLKPLGRNKICFDGIWTFSSDRVSLNSFQGQIELSFCANSVNIIAGAHKTIRAEVQLDGMPLSNQNKGLDVGENGNLVIKDYRLYNILSNCQNNYHTVEISFYGDDADIFSFSFG